MMRLNLLNFKKNLTNKVKNKSANTQSGQAMIFSVTFFVFLALAIIAGLVAPVVRDYRVTQEYWLSNRSYYLAESGVEDVYYRMLQAIPLAAVGSYNIMIGNDRATVTIDTMVASQRNVTAVGSVANRVRQIDFRIVNQSGLTFQTGLQFGLGGFYAQGANSYVAGTVTSMGPVSGSNSNIITSGGALSSGANGLVSNMRVTSASYAVYAHNIVNSIIARSAYYQSIDASSSVGGSPCPNAQCFPGSPDQPSYPLPISDTVINLMEQTAQAGGTYAGACPYNISSGNVNLGPIVINCSSFNVSGTGQVTINGPIWVKGNINISGSARLVLGPSVPTGKSIMLIADKTTDRITSSQISINTVSSVTGIGSDSFVIMVSQNNAAELGSAQDAIDLISSGATGSPLIAYAPHGHIDVQTSDGVGMLRITSGYKATLTTTNAVLAGRPNPVTISFPNTINLWDVTKWKEI